VKTAQTQTHKPAKPLHIRSADTKYLGEEPTWKFQPEAERRVSRLANAFNWYNYYLGKKEVKEFVADWMDRHEDKNAKLFRSVPDQSVPSTTGWLCRMNTMGLELTEHETLYIQKQISDLLNKHKPAKKLSTKAQESADAKAEQQAETARVTIQDRLREKVSECAGEIEGMFDEFVVAGAKMSADYKPITLIRGMNIAPQMVHSIVDDWKKRVAEFEEAIAGRDAQLVEGYSPWTKTQLKNFVKFGEQVIADCGSYVQIKKVERKPRVKKAVSPEKLASKFKFLREFPELKLKSEAPAKLVGASEAWLYDTKKRKLIHVVADTHAGTVSVKSSSIVGMDTVQSQQKTLRKPAEQIKALLAGGKPAQRKYFKDIKSTEVKFNGRGNENLIILKAY
jgi:hypothetical protein